jgi:hypothetical protein
MESLERKEEAGESMNEFIVKYINLYLNNNDTKIALWHRRYTRVSQLLLYVPVRQLLAFSLCNIGDIL